MTATREETTRASLPTNTSRLDADDISFLRAEEAGELLNRLPGVGIQPGNGVEHLTAIRSPVLTGGAGAGSFLYLENSVPLRAAGFANVNGLFEAHTEIAGAVEVVRGPGSAFYGSNAVHGLVNVISPAPGAPGFLDVSADTRGHVTGNALRGIESGRQGMLGGLTLTHDAGNQADSGYDTQKLTLVHRIDGPRITANTVLAAVNLNQETAGFIVGPEAYRNRTLSLTNPNPEAYRDAQALRLSSAVTASLGGPWHLTLTPFARWNEMTLFQHFLPYQGIEESGHWSLGTLSTLRRDLGTDGALFFGLDTEYTEGFLSEVQTLPSFGPFPQGVHYDYTVGALVIAPYLHLDIPVSTRVRLVGGLRAEWTRYDYDTATPADTTGRFRRPEASVDDFFTLTPKIGAVAQVTDEVQAFANYARGARAPQTSDLYRLQSFQEPGAVEVETLDSLEAGLRGRLGRARFEIVAFWMDKDNFFFRNADGLNVPDGKTRHRGVEGELALRLSDRLTFEGVGTYARHSYEFDDIVGNTSEIIRKGNDVDTAPRTIGSARLVWAPSARARIALEWQHMGAYYTDAANEHRYEGHDLLNLRASISPAEGVDLFGAVRNLLNTDHADRADFAFGSDRYFPGDGITASVGLRVPL
ncbi:MAG: TonB-dependent receptor [Alphaproteobacteria bacterium]|nr:TonB-dependent receptor [Alphaproteobacteria bacterium]